MRQDEYLRIILIDRYIRHNFDTEESFDIFLDTLTYI